jgi:O-acetyl-ADP-ribose deacetylase (regulator of RNase III)/uncharacterized protein YwgA
MTSTPESKMLKVLIGDIFATHARTLVNTVNCVGIMGKGVALEFKKRYPAMFDDYVERCSRKEVRVGEPYLYSDFTGASVINFPTKEHWRSPSRLSDIERGLDHFVRNHTKWGLTSVAFPPLGCGNGGLEWSEVGPLIHAKLSGLDLETEVYAPYGTPKQQLTPEFLRAPAQLLLDDKGRRQEKLNPEWAVLIEVLRELGQQPYASPVGRTIFQKICYVLTELGLQTGFEFDKGSYGPFASEVKLALHDFANRNWLQEQPLGKMIVLRVGPQYERDRARFAEVLKRHQGRIAKTVDLFSRIKSTEQAEEVLTVLFASRQLKAADPQREVAEQQLHDYILEWKKAWRTDEKREAVASAIRHLVLLGWMKLQVSESLPQPV